MGLNAVVIEYFQGVLGLMTRQRHGLHWRPRRKERPLGEQQTTEDAIEASLYVE